MGPDMWRLWFTKLLLLAAVLLAVCLETRSEDDGSLTELRASRIERDLQGVTTVLLVSARPGSVPPVGILTKTARTFVQDGASTEFATQVLGTTLDNGRLYARILSTSSRVFYDKEPTPDTATPYVVYPSRARDDDWQLRIALDNAPIKVLKDLESAKSEESLENNSSSQDANSKGLKLDELSRENDIFSRREFGGSDSNGQRLKPAKVRPADNLPTYTVKHEYVSNLDNSEEEPKSFRQRLPKIFKPQAKPVPQERKKVAESKPLATVTYHGFAEFTTTVGETVIVFSPSTSPAPVGRPATTIKGDATLRPDDGVAVVKIRPTSVISGQEKTKQHQSGGRKSDPYSETGDPLLDAINRANIQPSVTEDFEAEPSTTSTEPLLLIPDVETGSAKPTGLLKVVDSTTSLDGTTTHYKSLIYGTYIGTNYAQVIHTSSNVYFFPDEATATYDSEDTTVDYGTTVTEGSEDDLDTTLEMTTGTTPRIITTSEETPEMNELTTPLKGTTDSALTTLKDILESARRVVLGTTESDAPTLLEDEIPNDIGAGDPQGRSVKGGSPRNELGHPDGKHQLGEQEEKISLATRLLPSTVYKTFTYFTTFFIPEGDQTTTSVRSSEVVSSEVTYLTELILPSETVSPVLPTALNEPSTTTTGTPTLESTGSFNLASGPFSAAPEEETTKQDEEIELIFKTLYTTYTYLTTFFQESTSSISSREVVETNVITQTVGPNGVSAVVAGLFEKDESTLISPTKVSDSVLPSTTPSREEETERVPTTLEQTTEESLTTLQEQDTTTDQNIPTESGIIVKDLEERVPEIEQSPTPTLPTQEVKEQIKTYYTTYTYFTTIFVDDETEIETRTEVFTNVVTETIQPTAVIPVTIQETPKPTTPKAAIPPPEILAYLEALQRKKSQEEALLLAKKVQQESFNKPEESTAVAEELPPKVETTTENPTTLLGEDQAATERSLFPGFQVGAQVTPNPPMEGEVLGSMVTDVVSSSSSGGGTVLDVMDKRNAVPEDQELSESNHHEVEPAPTLLLQTSYTTFTYFTTMYKGEESNVVSRLETVTNVVTETIRPTAVVHETETSTMPVTYFTTFTYWTTFYRGGDTVTTSREETVSNVVTPGLAPTPTVELGVIMTYRPDTYLEDSEKESKITADNEVVTPSEIVTTENPKAAEVGTTPAIAANSKDIVAAAPTELNVLETTLIKPEPTTYYTTYTYFTTSYIGNETILNSRLETVTSVSIPDVAQLLPTQLLSAQPVATGRAIDGPVFKQVLATEEKPSVTTETSKTTELPKIGLISTIRSSQVNDGTTTHYTTDVHGTYIDGLYAQVVESSTRVETPPLASSVPTPVLPTGVLSMNKGSVIDADEVTTIYFTTKQVGTLFDGLYAKVIESTSSTKIDEERKATIPPTHGHRTGLVRLIQGQIESNGTTTFYQSKVIGTSIEGRYAQIIESTSSFLSATPTVNIAPTSTLPPVKATEVPEISPSPAVIQSSLSEDPTTESPDHEDSEENEEGEEEDEEGEGGQSSKKKSRLTFSTRKRTFTPVFRPFASRSRPTFNPKRKGAQGATTITRTDITPTITATLAGKGNRFASSRGRVSSPIGPYSSTLSPSGSRRFAGRRGSTNTASSLASTIAGSSRGRAQSRISPSSVFQGNRRGPTSIRGSSARVASRASSSAFPGASTRFRSPIRPSSTLLRGQATVRHDDQENDANEFTTTTLVTEETLFTEYTDGGETVTTPLQTTTESPRRSTNPLLRFRRPINLNSSGRSGTTPRPPTTTRRNGNLNRATSPSVTRVTNSRANGRSPNVPISTRPRQSSTGLFPPRGLLGKKQELPTEEQIEPNNEDLEGEGEENFEDDPVEEIADNDYEGSEHEDRINRRSGKSIKPTVQIRPFRGRRVRRQASQLRTLSSRFRRPGQTSSAKSEEKTSEASENVSSKEETGKSSSKPIARYNNRGRSLTATRPTGKNSNSNSDKTSSAESTESGQSKARSRSKPTNGDRNGASSRIKPSPTSNNNGRQFTLREKDSGSSSRSSYKRPSSSSSSRSNGRSSNNSDRVRPPRLRNGSNKSGETTSSSRSRVPPSSNRGTSRPPTRSGSRRGGSSRSRGSLEDIREAPTVYPDFDGTITVTHYVPTEVTIPVVNNGVTEQRNIITAQPSTEVLGPSQYSTVTGGDGRPLVVIVSEVTGTNPQGQTEITRFLLHETPTTRVSHTLTTLGGRRASQSVIVPSTVYSVENVVSTVQPSLPGNAPLANILLSQLLLGQLGQPNPLLQPQGTPSTQYNTRTTSYVTTITKQQSTVIPLTFRGKEILTTLVDTSTDVVTATEFITDTVVVTPTAALPAANLNSLLLLLQQTPQKSANPLLDPLFAAAPFTQSNTLPGEVERRHQPADSDYNKHDSYEYSDEEEEAQDYKKSSKGRNGRGKSESRKDNKREDHSREESSVVTLYVSGRRPGEFSTVLSTVKVSDTASSSRRRRRDVEDMVVEVRPSVPPSLHAGPEVTILAGSEDSLDAHAPTQSLESVVDDYPDDYRPSDFTKHGWSLKEENRRGLSEVGEDYLEEAPRKRVRIRVPVVRKNANGNGNGYANGNAIANGIGIGDANANAHGRGRQHKLTVVRRRPISGKTEDSPLIAASHTPRRIVVTRVRTLGLANAIQSDSKLAQDVDNWNSDHRPEVGRHKVTITRRRRIESTPILATPSEKRGRITRKKLVAVRPVQPTPSFAIITTGFFTAPSSEYDEEYSEGDENEQQESKEEVSSTVTPELEESPNLIDSKPEVGEVEGEKKSEQTETKVLEESSVSSPVIITDNFFFPPSDDEEYEEYEEDYTEVTTEGAKGDSKTEETPTSTSKSAKIDDESDEKETSTPSEIPEAIEKEQVASEKSEEAPQEEEKETTVEDVESGSQEEDKESEEASTTMKAEEDEIESTTHKSSNETMEEDVAVTDTPETKDESKAEDEENEHTTTSKSVETTLPVEETTVIGVPQEVETTTPSGEETTVVAEEKEEEGEEQEEREDEHAVTEQPAVSSDAEVETEYTSGLTSEDSSPKDAEDTSSKDAEDPEEQPEELEQPAVKEIEVSEDSDDSPSKNTSTKDAEDTLSKDSEDSSPKDSDSTSLKDAEDPIKENVETKESSTAKIETETKGDPEDSSKGEVLPEVMVSETETPKDSIEPKKEEPPAKDIKEVLVPETQKESVDASTTLKEHPETSTYLEASVEASAKSSTPDTINTHPPPSEVGRSFPDPVVLTSHHETSESAMKSFQNEEVLTVQPIQPLGEPSTSIFSPSVELSPSFASVLPLETSYPMSPESTVQSYPEESEIPSVIPLGGEYTPLSDKSRAASSMEMATVTTSISSPTPEEIEAGLADDLYLSLSRPDFPEILPSKPLHAGHEARSESTDLEPSTSVYYTETVVTSTRLRTYTYVVTQLNGLETKVTSSTTVRPRVTTLTLTVPVTVTVTPTVESSAFSSVYSPVPVAGEHEGKDEEGRRLNLATRVMSNGVEVIVAGPTPALRWENSVPQPTLTLSDAVVMMLPQDKPNEFVTKTCTTTFTYLTTITKDGTTTVSTEQQVIANTATEERHRKPGSETAAVTLEASPTLRTEVFKTTYTYLTLNTDHSNIDDALESSTKVITNTVTAPQHYLDMILEPSEAPRPETNTYLSTRMLEKTFMEDGRTRIETTSDTITQLIVTESAPPPRPTSVTTTLTALDSTEESMTDVMKTYYITYSYYNTFLEKGSTVVRTNVATSTDVVLEKVPVKKTTTKTALVNPTPEPIQIFATKTYLTTFTYFTTLLQAGPDGETSTTVSSRSQIVENVVTESITPSLLDPGYMNALLTTAHHSDPVKNVVTGSTIIFFDEEDQIDPTTSSSFQEATSTVEIPKDEAVPSSSPATEASAAVNEQNLKPSEQINQESNVTVAADSIQNKKPTNQNTSDLQVSNLLSLGSLGINSLSALGPVITAMAGLLQGKTTATRRNDSIPQAETQEVTTQRSPIYIPVAEFADGDIEAAESQNIATHLANLNHNYIAETRHKVASSLADGIPISPGEVITANSDVIIGKPGKMAPRPPQTFLEDEEHIGMKPPPLPVPNIPVHPVLEVLENDRDDSQPQQPLQQTHKGPQIQIYPAHQVYEEHLKIPVSMPLDANPSLMLKQPQKLLPVQSLPPKRIGSKQDVLENDPLLKPPDRPNVEQYANPNLNSKEPEWSPEKPRRPWSAKDPLKIPPPHPQFDQKIDSVKPPIEKPWPMMPPEDQKRPPWAQRDPLLPDSPIVIQASESKPTPAEPIVHQVPHVIDRSTGQPLLVNIQPSQVANVVIPQGGTQALIFGDTSEPHISGQYFDDPSPYPESDVGLGFVGIQRVEDLPQYTNGKDPADYMVPPSPPSNFKPENHPSNRPATIPLSTGSFDYERPQDKLEAPLLRPEKKPSDVHLIKHPENSGVLGGQGHVHTEILVHHRPETINVRPQSVAHPPIHPPHVHSGNHLPPRGQFSKIPKPGESVTPPRRTEMSSPSDNSHRYILLPKPNSGNEIMLNSNWKADKKPPRIVMTNRLRPRPPLRSTTSRPLDRPIYVERPNVRKPVYSGQRPPPKNQNVQNTFMLPHRPINGPPILHDPSRVVTSTPAEGVKDTVTDRQPSFGSHPQHIDLHDRPPHFYPEKRPPSMGQIRPQTERTEEHVPTGAVEYHNPSNPKVKPEGKPHAMNPPLQSFDDVSPDQEEKPEIWQSGAQTEKTLDSEIGASEPVNYHNNAKESFNRDKPKEDLPVDDQTGNSSMQTKNSYGTNGYSGGTVFGKPIVVESQQDQKERPIWINAGAPFTIKNEGGYQAATQTPYGPDYYNAKLHETPVVQGKPFAVYAGPEESNYGQKLNEYDIVQGVPSTYYGNKIFGGGHKVQQGEQTSTPRTHERDDTIDLKPPAIIPQFVPEDKPNRYPRPPLLNKAETRPVLYPGAEIVSQNSEDGKQPNENKPEKQKPNSSFGNGSLGDSGKISQSNLQLGGFVDHHWNGGVNANKDAKPSEGEMTANRSEIDPKMKNKFRNGTSGLSHHQVEGHHHHATSTESIKLGTEKNRLKITQQEYGGNLAGTRIHPEYPHIITKPKPKPQVPGPITISTANGNKPETRPNVSNIRFSMSVEAIGEETDSKTQTERPPSMLIPTSGNSNDKKKSEEKLDSDYQQSSFAPSDASKESMKHESKIRIRPIESSTGDMLNAMEGMNVPSRDMMPPPLRPAIANQSNKDEEEDLKPPPIPSRDVVGLSPPPVDITTTDRPMEDKFSFGNVNESGLKPPPKYIPLKESSVAPLPSVSMVPPSPRPSVARPFIVELLSQDMVPPPPVTQTTRPLEIATVRPAVAVSGSIQIATAVATSHIPVIQDIESKIPIIHGTVDLPVVVDVPEILRPIETRMTEHVSIYTVRPFDTRPVSRISVQPTAMQSTNLVVPTKLRPLQVDHIQPSRSSATRDKVEPTRSHVSHDIPKNPVKRPEHPVFLESSHDNILPSSKVEPTESLTRVIATSEKEASRPTMSKNDVSRVVVASATEHNKRKNETTTKELPSVVTRVDSSITKVTSTLSENIDRRNDSVIKMTKDVSSVTRGPVNSTTSSVHMKPKGVTRFQTSTVTRTETSVLGSPPTTRTLLLTHTMTSTTVETVTETLLRPTSVISTVTSTILQSVVTRIPPSYENVVDNDSIFVVMSDQKPPEPGAEEVEAEYGDISRDEQDPTGNEVHRVLAGGVLGAPVVSLQPIVNQCTPECRASRAEICAEVASEMRCVCRPGFARMFPDRPCKPTYTYTLRVGLDRIGHEPVVYEASLNDSTSAAFRRLVGPTRDALDRTLMQSDLRDVYRGLKIAGFSAEPTKVDFHVQLSDNANETRLKEVIRKYLIGSNYSLGGTEVYASKNLDLIDAIDFDECAVEEDGPHHDCSPNAACFNLRGSYQCSCKEGWADLSENPAYPGRFCSQAPLGCPSCNNKGHCVTNTNGQEVCECFPWHSGQRCQVNLKVLLIALVTTGAILLGLLAVCVGMACFRQTSRKRRTGDRRAMIPGTGGDTSSEGSVTDLAIPHHVPHVLPPPPQMIAPLPPTKRPARKISAKPRHPPRKATMVPAPVPVNDEQRDRSLTVMIPRAKYRSAPQSPQNYKSGMSTFSTEEHKLINYLESGTHNAGNRKQSISSAKDCKEADVQIVRTQAAPAGALVSAGFQVSATVTRPMDAESTLARSCGETTVETATKVLRTSDLPADLCSTLARSCGETTIHAPTKLLRLDLGEAGSTLARSCGETTIQPPTKVADARRNSVKDARDNRDTRDSASEGHTMAERDLGSTLRLPAQHPPLYSPDRTSDRESNFDSL